MVSSLASIQISKSMVRKIQLAARRHRSRSNILYTVISLPSPDVTKALSCPHLTITNPRQSAFPRWIISPFFAVLSTASLRIFSCCGWLSCFQKGRYASISFSARFPIFIPHFPSSLENLPPKESESQAPLPFGSWKT